MRKEFEPKGLKKGHIPVSAHSRRAPRRAPPPPPPEAAPPSGGIGLAAAPGEGNGPMAAPAPDMDDEGL